MKTSLLLIFLFAICACGVKGDPLPPEKPAELGRGRPTYKKATQDIRVEKKRRTEDDDEDKDEDRDNE